MYYVYIFIVGEDFKGGNDVEVFLVLLLFVESFV